MATPSTLYRLCPSTSSLQMARTSASLSAARVISCSLVRNRFPCFWNRSESFTFDGSMLCAPVKYFRVSGALVNSLKEVQSFCRLRGNTNKNCLG